MVSAYRRSGTTYVYILSLVHSSDRLLAAGFAWTLSLSAGVDSASSLPHSWHRGGRSSGTIKSCDYAPGAGSGWK